jgi:D-serine deaminase-like pyridoxal phosphate-dependent protein
MLLRKDSMAKNSDDLQRRTPAMPRQSRAQLDTTEEKPTTKPVQEPVSLAEALQTEMLINQALIDLLVAKGIITQEELLKRIRELTGKPPADSATG